MRTRRRSSRQTQAIQQVFNWFNANGGANRPVRSADIPGVNTLIGGSLDSPNCDRVRRRRQSRCSGSAAACASTGSSATSATSTVTRTDLVDRPGDQRAGHVRRQPDRELERSRAPLSGRDVPGELPLRQQRRHRWQLHAVADVGQLRRREPGQRSADGAALLLSRISRGPVERSRGEPRDRPAASRAHLRDLSRADGQQRGIAGCRPGAWHGVGHAVHIRWRELHVSGHGRGPNQLEPVRRESGIRAAGDQRRVLLLRTRCLPDGGAVSHRPLRQLPVPGGRGATCSSTPRC